MLVLFGQGLEAAPCCACAVLDVGTGTGAAAAGASERGAKVTAVDAEPGMVVRAALAAPESEFAGPGGGFALPHAALMAHGQA
ncbi:methyltransferase domain-containing protein [Streptomyces sp. NPDC029044]|uniref:methyltransferase domain-containing protein n=1 Tax=Streptomyces sp. NPDC029044 TaxID=3157198 RepID=UPI00340EBE4D